MTADEHPSPGVDDLSRRAAQTARNGWGPIPLPAGRKWPPADGFGACAMYDSYTFAGAASVMGDDGLMYHHLFVR